MSDSNADLRAIFETFASFGARGVTDKLDGVKFFKFARDSKLVDSKLTRTDVDMVFTRAKPKGERNLDFRGFITALHMLAEEKYKDLPESEAYERLVSTILSSSGPEVRSTVAGVAKPSPARRASPPRGGPAAAAEEDDYPAEASPPKASPSRPSAASVTDRLTDTSKYTGSHRERFAEDGSGRGLAGRDSVSKGSGTAGAGGSMGLDEEGYVGGFKKVKGHAGPASSKAQSITDRLTDTSKYTGAHKSRFDADGHGRGASGRRDDTAGDGYVASYKNKGSYDKTH